MSDLTTNPWFFCGIGGSGMLPLALILKGHGAEIAGSDRSRDQGRTPEKFAWLERQGFTLFRRTAAGSPPPIKCWSPRLRSKTPCPKWSAPANWAARG